MSQVVVAYESAFSDDEKEVETPDEEDALVLENLRLSMAETYAADDSSADDEQSQEPAPADVGGLSLIAADEISAKSEMSSEAPAAQGGMAAACYTGDAGSSAPSTSDAFYFYQGTKNTPFYIKLIIINANSLTAAIRGCGYTFFVKWDRFPGARLKRYLQKWRRYPDTRLYT